MRFGLRAGRLTLTALENIPGVRPIAIGEVLRRLIAKCELSVAKGEAQEVAELIGSVEDCKQAKKVCSFHALIMGGTEDGSGMGIPSH